MAASGGSVDDVPVKAVWARLAADPTAVLVDVRTRAEWSFVGLPNLDEIGRRPVLIEWQTFPDGRPNGAFVEELSAQLRQLGADQDTEVFFICRSGARSRMAAQAAAAAGYRKCHNVAEGFEGPLDPKTRHRGGVAGWKAAGLPWSQG
ncbi:MAG: rhodanese-like domain-containing protein [Bacteroidota bacterium]|nr:rhodanese-like domain-containing protein [Hyphomicrobiaceae bacterium]